MTDDQARASKTLLPTSYSSPKGTYGLLPTPFDPGLLVAGLLALFVILPLLRPGLPGTADTPIHFYRTLEFARSWGPGVVYPRWAPDLAYGYGYPLWNFAPPLPYLIALALGAVGLSLEASLKGLIILTSLGYALGAYLFVRDSLGPRAGLVGAAVYTLAPFALREVLLYGGNYPQYLAVGLFPWLFWAVRRTMLRQAVRWPDVLPVALFYGAAILSHLFHALVLTPVVTAYALVLWLAGGRDLRRLAASALGLGLGLLGTAFFWLPAFFERAFTRAVEARYVSVSPFYLRFLDWRELLAWPQPLDIQAANPWVPFSLGLAALGLAGLGCLALATKQGTRDQGISLAPWPSARTGWAVQGESGNRRSGQIVRWQALFFTALLALTVFMTLSISNWLWANAPLLAVAEFPWRWLGLANLSLAFLAGASVHWFAPPRRTAFALGAVLAVALSSAVYLYPFRPFVRYAETPADMARYELAHQALGTTTLAEYLPRWAASVPDSSPLAGALTRGDAVEKLDPASLPEGATAQLLDQSSVSEAYHFDSPHPFRARFFTYYFPGWTAFLDGRPLDILIEPESGLISVPVPAGAHELRLRFVDTPLRAAANAVTALTLAALGGISLRSLARLRSPTPRPPHSPAPLHRGAALLIGATIIALLLLKILVVDPHTGWFRRASPPGEVSGVQHPLRVDLDGRFRLLGYNLDRATLPQGGTLHVTLYWQAQGPTDTNYRSFVHLDAPADQRTWAGSDNYHPGDVTAQIELPTGTWDAAHYVRDEHRLHLPPEVPPAGFDLRAGLYDPDTGRRLPIAGEEGDTVRLGSIQVTPGRGLRPGEVPNPLSYRLGDCIRLLGYDWHPGETELTLYWGADAPPEADYVVFVHLLDDAGRLVWGADGPPLGGLYPSSAWRPGDVVADPRGLSPAGLLPGEYTLVVGLYDPATLSRLPVSDAAGQSVAGDAVPLTRLAWP